MLIFILISVKCQPLPCQQSVLHSKQNLNILGEGEARILYREGRLELCTGGGGGRQGLEPCTGMGPELKPFIVPEQTDRHD